MSTNSRRPITSTSNCRPGSIEHQLDMCENAPAEMRGDQVQFTHGNPPRRTDDPNFEMDMATEDREGDEMSGDDHSSGLQGGETELAHQPNIDRGMPGDATEEQEDEFDRIEQGKVA
jgi:hypothetical protein